MGYFGGWRSQHIRQLLIKLAYKKKNISSLLIIKYQIYMRKSMRLLKQFFDIRNEYYRHIGARHSLFFFNWLIKCQVILIDMFMGCRKRGDIWSEIPTIWTYSLKNLMNNKQWSKVKVISNFFSHWGWRC